MIHMAQIPCVQEPIKSFGSINKAGSIEGFGKMSVRFTGFTPCIALMTTISIVTISTANLTERRTGPLSRVGAATISRASSRVASMAIGSAMGILGRMMLVVTIGATVCSKESCSCRCNRLQ
ncbi:hypothetical protein I3842_11G079500 [Carya illinoinensis]|uniref:Uncharacterized protein n=1 Tax=Carya illinoinensis TaxID=32201 RepID=A0A922DN23_CARIL|nr:hypothetical protein I3842_11G079500 [Carya illinoinensis]